MELKNISLEEVEVPLHHHPLIPFTRFDFGDCIGCNVKDQYIYGGYRCNELGCDRFVFHKDCAMPLQTINHSSHPDHSLQLLCYLEPPRCSQCAIMFRFGYCCLICDDFKLDLLCARMPSLVLPEIHEHPLIWDHYQHRYKCHRCKFVFDLFDVYPEVYHTSHPQHPLKLLKCEAAPDYAEKKCLLCQSVFNNDNPLYHCDVCNFSICGWCQRNPPPVDVVSLTTHWHQLRLVPRLITFTCNVCGTQGDRSPYFCLQCNFMIHRECIDLPRLININRHDHRISYTRRLGHDGEWRCGVCRKKVNGFYGSYTCSKCSNYVVHSRCATNKDVWDMVELEGTPEEPEESPPFEEIDGENTIKHLSHDHNLRLHKDEMILPESTLCVACVFQICSEPFYSCEQCDFIVHQKCANLPRKIRHVSSNKPLRLQTDSLHEIFMCVLCKCDSTGFRYRAYGRKFVDVRCGSVSEPLKHGSHQHPLYYTSDRSKTCDYCFGDAEFSCDECDFSLDFKCATLPEKVMRHRYDDHPLFLSYGESSTNGDYWCEACETKVDPMKWFYTCNQCGVVLHISCVIGEFSYIKPGTHSKTRFAEVISNTSICRRLCYKCNTQCKLSSILQVSVSGYVAYACSYSCFTFLLDTNTTYKLLSCSKPSRYLESIFNE